VVEAAEYSFYGGASRRKKPTKVNISDMPPPSASTERQVTEVEKV
jgi:hypothetical protein